MREKMKEYKVEVLIYILIFLIFFYIFAMVPPVCDRLMEGVLIYDLGDPLYFLFGQIRWFQDANARVLSNFFSVIIDRNVIVRAFCNALMLLGISYFTFSVTNASKRARVIYLVCLFLFSWGIQQEVYLYATTLYVGGIFLIMCIMWILCKEPKINNAILYILVFVASTWLESISLMVITMALFTCIWDYFRVRKITSRNINIVILSVLGFLIMFLCSKYASNGRLNKEERYINISGTHIETLIFQNIGLFIVLAIIMVCITKRYYEIEKRKVKVIHSVYWLLVTCTLCIWSSEGVYNTISEDPKYIWAGNAIAWKNFHEDTLDRFYEEFDKFIHYIWPMAAIISMFSIIYILYKMGKLVLGIEILGIMAAGAVIDFLGIQNGDRIVFPGFFMFITLIVLLLSEYESNLMNIRKRCNTLIVLFCLVGFIQLDHIGIVVNNAKQVSDERWRIADEIRLEQGMGRWNYDNIAIMPTYDKDGLPGEDYKQPEIDSLRYYIMLRYYKLDEDTKIIFE